MLCGWQRGEAVHGRFSVLPCADQKPVGASAQHGPTLTGQTAQLWTPLLQKKPATTKKELKNPATKVRNNEMAFIKYDFTGAAWLIFGD